MQAPLGRAVIGGLVMSTFATLLVVPSIFALVIGRRTYRSTSIYPDDRESAYYDPKVFAHKAEIEAHERHEEQAAHELVVHHTDDEIIGFLRSMLHEIRAKRRDMVTHQKVDELRGPLGFAKEDSSGDESSSGPDAHGHRGPRAKGHKHHDGGGHTEWPDDNPSQGGPSSQGDS